MMNTTPLSTGNTNNNDIGFHGMQNPDSKGFKISAAARVAIIALAVTLTATTVVAIVATVVIPCMLATVALIVSSVALTILLANELFRRYGHHLPKPVQQFINTVRATVAELFVVIPTSVLFPVDLTRFDPKENVDANQRPILLVHGYLHNSSAWIYHRYRLRQMGYKNIYTINLGHPFQSIEDYAQKVAEKVKKIEQLTGSKKVALIGHSMGGIVSSYYAMNLAPEDKVTDVITLGSPLIGTKMAYIGIGQCAKQMRYKSKFMTELRDKIEKATETLFHNIGSTSDIVVRPTRSAVVMKHHVFQSMGHLGYLYSDAVAGMNHHILSTTSTPNK